MLEMEVKVGGQPIGTLHIERMDGQEGTDWDSVFSYSANLRWQLGNPKSNRHVEFNHRYGDEWPIFVLTALKSLVAQNANEMIKKAPTLGEIADMLKALKEQGVTLESLEYAAEQVWWKSDNGQ